MEKGIKYDSDKLLWSLVPWGPMHDVCRVYTDGAKKYTPDNWMKVEKKRYEEALMRHSLSYAGGEVQDPDSGSHHLAHVVANALIIMWHAKEENKKDSFDPTKYGFGYDVDWLSEENIPKLDFSDLIVDPAAVLS